MKRSQESEQEKLTLSFCIPDWIMLMECIIYTSKKNTEYDPSDAKTPN